MHDTRVISALGSDGAGSSTCASLDHACSSSNLVSLGEGCRMSERCCSSDAAPRWVSSSGSKSAMVTPAPAAFSCRCEMLMSGNPARQTRRRRVRCVSACVCMCVCVARVCHINRRYAPAVRNASAALNSRVFRRIEWSESKCCMSCSSTMRAWPLRTTAEQRRHEHATTRVLREAG